MFFFCDLFMLVSIFIYWWMCRNWGKRQNIMEKTNFVFWEKRKRWPTWRDHSRTQRSWQWNDIMNFVMFFCVIIIFLPSRIISLLTFSCSSSVTSTCSVSIFLSPRIQWKICLENFYCIIREKKMLMNVKRSQKNTKKLTMIWYYQLRHVFLRPHKDHQYFPSFQNNITVDFFCDLFMFVSIFLSPRIQSKISFENVAAFHREKTSTVLWGKRKCWQTWRDRRRTHKS